MSSNNVSPNTAEATVSLTKGTREKQSTDFQPDIVIILQIALVPFRMKAELSVSLDNMQLRDDFLTIKAYTKADVLMIWIPEQKNAIPP